MSQRTEKIKDYVDVRRHPTVVRLQDLNAGDPRWLTQSFLLTSEVESHLRALSHLLGAESGSGAFLIGHYGSGKSHFLAYLALQLRSDNLLPNAPTVATISLVNFSASNRLEDIVSTALGIEVARGDRRPAWNAMLAQHPKGLVLLLDELSEFLRAKSSPQAFTEDVRFLQFLGEWAQDQRFWIVAAMQESIEHTGELEYGLYRKIKDRYPIRLLLTPAHVQSLIADSILVKQPAYTAAVERLCRDLRTLYPVANLDFQALQSVYPLHPATLEILAEVRDRFSQARGVVDFTVTRLRGDAARGVESFLEQPFGNLITPDVIVDHFRDLLEVQPELLPLAQQVFPWYERHLGALFERPALRTLAERVLKLLVLVHLSPAREALTAHDAAGWLLLSAARVDRERNQKIIEKVLTTLVERGRYVVEHANGYHLDLRDDSGAMLDRLLTREIAALEGQDTLVLEALVPLVPAGGFNPFGLPRDTWQQRRIVWHFHERRYAVWMGDGQPESIDGLGLCVRLPWGGAASVAGLWCIAPAPIRVSRDLVELAALARLREQPHGPELSRRIQQRLDTRAHLFQQAVRSAWHEARLITPAGNVEVAPRIEGQSTFDSWLETVALTVLRRIYPAFERFAPGHGPLPKEAWLRFMRFASKEDIGVPLAEDYVRLIREAYLVPMGLLRRKGQDYATPANLDRNELVQLLSPLLEHNPSPRTIHEHFAQPIYGLVPDQVNLLLVFLLLQGEIDIVKDRKSYRESFETLPNPLHYDRVVPGHALKAEHLAALERLCQGVDVATPAHWSVLTQRRCAARLAEIGRQQAERLQPLVRRLVEIEQGKALAARLQQHLDRWSSLEKSQHPLHGLEQLLFEIGSPSAFAEEIATYRELPDRIERLVAETQRHTHLLGHPVVLRLLQHGEEIGDAPALDETKAVEVWLQRATRLYEQYRVLYADRHEHWWRELTAHPIWAWSAPNAARSRHLDLREAIGEIEACRREAERQRCRGLVNLDYQPQCTCGFDGESAPIRDVCQRFAALGEEIAMRLRLFFQQDRVKGRLREWQRQGVEVNGATLAYLDGTVPVPEIEDVGGFDDFLDGIDLATEVDVGVVVELLRHRLWRPDDLLLDLQRLLTASRSQRLRFTGGHERVISTQMIDWCARLALSHAEPLPEDLTRQERSEISAALRPEWITAQALRRLESIGLDDSGVDRVLGWLIDGHIGLPESDWRGSSIVGAVAELLHPASITTPEDLAALSERLYRAHERLLALARERWLAHLDALARTSLPGIPALTDVLRANLDAQWLLVDCLGMPLVNALKTPLIDMFKEWEQHAPRFAETTGRTTTDGCYRALLAAGIEHSFEKVDVIDALIHEGPTTFVQLTAMARTKLTPACRTLLPRFDPARPLLIFADHGFRLAVDGRRYTHGGASTLERIVPVWRFMPRQTG